MRRFHFLTTRLRSLSSTNRESSHLRRDSFLLRHHSLEAQLLKLCKELFTFAEDVVPQIEAMTSKSQIQRRKGNPEAARKIAEVLDDLPMQEALARIADPKTAFFTMGARNLSTPLPAVDFGQKDIEFSYNYAQAISDAQNYFPLFFHFDQYIKKQRLPSPVLFEWEPERKFIQTHSLMRYLGINYCLQNSG